MIVRIVSSSEPPVKSQLLQGKLLVNTDVVIDGDEITYTQLVTDVSSDPVLIESKYHAEKAQSEMQIELEWYDLQMRYHQSCDTSRAVSTVELLNDYAIECRNYVRNIDGVLTIVGNRPIRPTNDVIRSD